MQWKESLSDHEINDLSENILSDHLLFLVVSEQLVKSHTKDFYVHGLGLIIQSLCTNYILTAMLRFFIVAHYFCNRHDLHVKMRHEIHEISFFHLSRYMAAYASLVF